MKVVTTKEQRAALAKEKIYRRRSSLISTVKNGLTTFLEVGKALLELHDDEHWKENYTSWADFCLKEFGISSGYARRLIGSVEAVSSLPSEHQSKIINESQAREISKTPTTDRSRVLDEAEKMGGITAGNIASARSRFVSEDRNQNVPIGTPPVSVKSGSPSASKTANTSNGKVSKNSPKITWDKVGTPIPSAAVQYWDRVSEVQSILSQLSELKLKIVKARSSEDAMWMKVPNYIEDSFSNLYYVISEAKPYAVCTSCQGSFDMQPQGCAFCHNTGLISKHRWETMSPKEIKDLRIRQNREIAQEHPDSPLNQKESNETLVDSTD